MNKSDVALIVLRSMAVYLLLSALSALPAGLRVMNQTSWEFESASIFISASVVMSILAIALWFVAPFVAMLMVKKVNRPIDKDMFNSKFHVESTIFTTVGLILVVTSIAPMIFNLAYNNTEDIQLHIADESQKVLMQASQNGFTAQYASMLIVGLLLLFFAEPFWQFIAKIKARLMK